MRYIWNGKDNIVIILGYHIRTEPVVSTKKYTSALLSTEENI